MKKLLLSIGLLSAVMVCEAQNFQGQSFLGDVSAIYITNTATFVTNLLSGASSGNTNSSTVIVTNKGGTYITGSTNRYLNTLGQASLWVPRDAAWVTGAATNACILLGVGGAGANATNAISLAFRALPNGTVEDDHTAEYIVSTTANTAVVGNWRLAFPASAFVGCKSIRLVKVYTAVDSSTAGSQFVITNISLCGFVP